MNLYYRWIIGMNKVWSALGAALSIFINGCQWKFIITKVIKLEAVNSAEYWQKCFDIIILRITWNIHLEQSSGNGPKSSVTIYPELGTMLWEDNVYSTLGSKEYKIDEIFIVWENFRKADEMASECSAFSFTRIA